MQDIEEKFSKSVGKIIRKLRQSTSKKYVLFCDENEIADSTLNNVEMGLRSPKFYTIARIVKACGISFKDFGEILDKQLSDEFTIGE